MSVEVQELAQTAKEFINVYQGGFPVCETPYYQAATRLNISEDALIRMIRRLIDEGWLSRFGPIFDASRLGGAQTLAALTVPEIRYEEVAAAVNAFPEVAHNYRRTHQLNMWCVIATEESSLIDSTIEAIETATGLQVFNFPKLHEFYIGLRLRLGELGTVDTVRFAEREQLKPANSREKIDRAIILAMQAGLPLEHKPYAKLAAELKMDPERLMSRVKSMLDDGAIRRIGAIPNHYRLGLRANGMTVWNVNDAVAVEAGREIGALASVSHCYLRPRYEGIWPYNLFAMVHGQTRQQVETKARAISALLGKRCEQRDVLYSTGMLKKTGLRLTA